MPNGAQPMHPPATEAERDALVLPVVPEYLAKGLALRRWWAEVERNGGPKDRFQLTRDFDRPTRSYGFYADAPLPGGSMPVMGSFWK